MQLDYKILWIDNDLKSYIDNGSIKKIETFLSDYGFEPTIEQVTDEAELDKSLSKHKRYDLIISDFHLNKENGDVIIYRLREEKKLTTEILFYSSRTDFTEDNSVKERLAFMERINIQYGRDGLLEKIENVIKLTIERILEINATRGLITAATSELDVEIEDVYNIVIEQLTEDDLTSKVSKIFSDNYRDVKKKYVKGCKIKRDTYRSDYKKYFSVSDAFRKWDILKEILKIKPVNGFNLELFKKYNDEIIRIRNQFAHAKAKEKNGKMVLQGQLGKEDFEFDEDSCILIRKHIIEHKKNISNLKNILKSP